MSSGLYSRKSCLCYIFINICGFGRRFPLLYHAAILAPCLYTHFVESFYHEWMLNFVECFFSIYGVAHVVFVLLFVDVVDDVDGFSNPCIPDESHLVMVYDPLDVFLNSVC